MKRSITMLFSAALILGLSSNYVSAEATADDGINSSLRGKNAVFIDDTGTKAKGYVGEKPGKQKVLTRAYHLAPPQVPHTLEKMVMTPKKNTCLECHDLETYEMAEAPVMAESHYINGRTGEKLEAMYQGRYNCTQCHVAQVDAVPLVKNTFEGTEYVAKKVNPKAKQEKKEDDIF
jgi:cytochrome c-type protein NapB